MCFTLVVKNYNQFTNVLLIVVWTQDTTILQLKQSKLSLCSLIKVLKTVSSTNRYVSINNKITDWIDINAAAL